MEWQVDRKKYVYDRRDMTNANETSALISQAVAHHQRGRLAEAEEIYRRTLAHNPRHVDSLQLLGTLLHQVGSYAPAIELLGRAIDLNDWVPEFHCNLGAALFAAGKIETAETSCRRALVLRPDFRESYKNLGGVLQALGKIKEASASYRYADMLGPSLAIECSDLGTNLQTEGKIDEAVALYRRSIVLEPDFGVAYNNLGSAQQAEGRISEAIASYRQAIACKTDFATAHNSLGILLLLTGRLLEGWPQYEWRWLDDKNGLKLRAFSQPQWNGEDLAGRTILLHGEQGLGDIVMLCRYVPLVAARMPVVLELPRSIVSLLSPLGDVARIVAKGEALPAFDLHCPLGSLPLALSTTVETIPPPVPRLEVDPERVVKWRDRLPPTGYRVGICWQGNPSYPSDHLRSAPLSAFARLARIPGLHLISLQKQYGLDQLDGITGVITLNDDFDNGPDAFLDTAAVMMSLDLIITIDSAIAHLAGTLGRPVWLALQEIPHWPWMLNGLDTPWYPGMRLFRQESPAGWRPVFDRIAAELAFLTQTEDET